MSVALLAWSAHVSHGRPLGATTRDDVVADRALDGVSHALATVAARVRPSVVYITTKEIVPLALVDEAAPLLPPAVPPELAPFLRQFRRPPGGPRRGPGAEMESAGSGFVVSSDGYILTNAHVVDGARRVTVRLLDRREFRARVVGTDPTTDVAVLRIDATGLTPLPFGDSDSVQVGQVVLAVGNPLGESLTFSVTSGIVGAKGRVLQELPGRTPQSIQDFIQTDAPINPGSSGGPLVNTHGQLVGINAAIASPTGTYAGYGFAVPASLARRVMQQLIASGHVVRAALGVAVHDASAEDAAYVGLPQIRGVLVEDVEDADSPARVVGLRAGDVIIAVDGTPVDHVAQLQEATVFRTPGEVVALEVARRGGARATVRVPLRRAPDDSTAAAARVPRGDAGEGSVAPSAAPVAPLRVRVVPLDDDAERVLGLPSGVHGVAVAAVSPWGPAADRLAGFADGDGPDVILSVEGVPVRTPAALRDALGVVRPGDVVTLIVYSASSRTRRVERVRTATAADRLPPTAPS